MVKSGYHFYLKKCLLPVPPAKLQIKIKNTNDTITLINEGEINLLKAAGLTEIEFECSIPQSKYPYAVYRVGFQDAAFFLNYFEKLKRDKIPFQFIVSRERPNGKRLIHTNIKVSLEEYTITEQVEEGFDLTVKIKLKQYREYGTKIVTQNKETKKASVKKKRAESNVRETKPIIIGSDVIINGRLHRDSNGNGPGQTRTNYRGKVNFINKKGSCPYHVTTPSGGWLGWVAAASVKGV